MRKRIVRILPDSIDIPDIVIPALADVTSISWIGSLRHGNVIFSFEMAERIPKRFRILTCTHAHACTCTHISTHTLAHMQPRTCDHMQPRTCDHMHTHTCAHTHVRTHSETCTLTHTNLYTQAQTRAHTCAHTLTCTSYIIISLK